MIQYLSMLNDGDALHALSSEELVVNLFRLLCFVRFCALFLVYTFYCIHYTHCQALC